METPLIYERMATVLEELPSVGKDQKAQGFGANYKFRGIDDLYNALNPVLAKNKIFISPQILSHERTERDRKKDEVVVGVTVVVLVRVNYKFYTTDGSFIECESIGEANDTSDKATSKALSMAMKYALFQTFCIATEDIEDADKTKEDLEPQKPTKQQLQQEINKRQNTAERKQNLANEHKQNVKKLYAVLCADFDKYGDPFQYINNVLNREIGDLSEIEPNDLNLIRQYFNEQKKLEQQKQEVFA